MPSIPPGQAGSQLPRLKGRRKKKFYRDVEANLDKTPLFQPQTSNYENSLRAFTVDQDAYANYLLTLPVNIRRQREQEAAGHYTLAEWQELCARHEYKCLCCGRDDVKLTVDHVVPLSQGGSHWIANIQPLCGPCNISKGVKRTDYRPNTQHP